MGGGGGGGVDIRRDSILLIKQMVHSEGVNGFFLTV